jgi:hypothetical protein
MMPMRRMTSFDPRALAPIAPDADAIRLAELEKQLTARGVELNGLKVELRDLQTRYLSEIGALYRELNDLETQVIAVEVRAGLRPPPADDAVDDAGAPDASACTELGAPSDMLKRVFRDVARNIHPDRAPDEAARLRRHSLMAEANRAYAERDADRLLLILRRWERSPDAVPAGDPNAEKMRRQRRITEIEDQLAEIDAEFVELRNSAIARLQHKIDETRRQGWDLFAEMVAQVKADIARTQARLMVVRRMTGIQTVANPGG